MTQRSLTMLIVLNAVLLAALSVSVLTPPAAQAQFGGGSNFTMISGAITGRDSQDAVYVTDLSTSRLAAIIFNSSNNSFSVLDGVVVSEDAARPAGGGR